MLLKSRPQFYALSKNNHELFLKDELFETTHFIADTLVSHIEVVQLIKSNSKTDYFLVCYYMIYKFKERIIFKKNFLLIFRYFNF